MENSAPADIDLAKGGVAAAWAANLILMWIRMGGEMVTEQQFKQRLEVCKYCKTGRGVVHPIPGLAMEGCTICGCPFATKPRARTFYSVLQGKVVEANCPLDKWPALEPVD